MANGEDFADERTERALDWCEEIDTIRADDTATMPRRVKETDTKTLKIVLGIYEDRLDDFEKFGFEEAPFSDWDFQVRSAIRQELISRGLIPVPRELQQVVSAILDKPAPGSTKH